MEGMKELGLDLAEVHGLVDAELLLRAGDAVLRGLGQVKAGAACGAQLGNHLFVVREGQLDVDAGFLLELGHDVGGHVVGPGDQPQLLVLRPGGAAKAGGDKADAENMAHQAG